MPPHKSLPDEEIEYIDQTMSLLAQGAMPMTTGDDDADAEVDRKHRKAVSLIDRLTSTLIGSAIASECDDDYRDDDYRDDEERIGGW